MPAHIIVTICYFMNELIREENLFDKFYSYRFVSQNEFLIICIMNSNSLIIHD